jgi:twinkle protein
LSKSHLPCPSDKCDSSDGYSIDPRTGWGKCFVCDINVPPEKATENSVEASTGSTLGSTTNGSNTISNVTPIAEVFHAVEHRGINKQAATKYQIDLNLGSDGVEARYPYYKDGKHVANKVRTKDKKFWWEGDSNDVELYGQHLFDPGGFKEVTIVEGEYDAAAAWTLLGSRYPVVSVSSAGTALRDVRNNFEYLDSFDKIVLSLDADEVGRKTAKAIAELFAPGKCRILTMRSCKDPNAYLAEGKTKDYVDEWWKAPAYMPDGLKIGTDMWDEIINRPKHFQVPYPLEGLNRLTYGLRLSEMVVVTADTGIGKTALLKEVEYALLTNKELIEKKYGVGFLHLEEPNYDTALGLLSIHNSKPYHLPDTERTVDELRSAYDAVINNGRVVIWDHFGSNSVDAVLDKIRHMHALGCKYIVLDHLSIVVSDQSGDERKQLDEIATKAKTLCMNLNIALICVIHQNRQGTIRGTAGVEQLANIVIKLYRDNVDPDEWRRNVTKIMVEKNRFSGSTGPACYVFYNKITGRLEELSKEMAEAYEQGGNPNDTQLPF